MLLEIFAVIPEWIQNLGNELGDSWPIIVALVTLGSALRWLWRRLLDALRKELIPVQKELSSDDGSSIKDSVNRAEVKVDGILGTQRDIVQKIISMDASHKSDLKKLKEHIIRLDDSMAATLAGFRAVTASGSLGYYEVDQNRNVLKVNRAYLDIFNINEDEAMSGGWQYLIHPDDAPDFEHSLKAAFENHAPWIKQFRIIPKGSTTPVLLEGRSYPVFNTRGDFLGFAGTLRVVRQ